jgi:hypothetical protein
VAAPRLAALAVLALAAAGCPQKPVKCQEPFAGDPSQPLEAEAVLDVNGQLVDVAAGQVVDVEPPPQGGYVVYAGVRARNLDPCGVYQRAQFRDAATLAAVPDLDGRNSDLHATGDGWWAPGSLSDFSSLPNVPVCPDHTGGTPLGRRLVLEVTVTDRGGRSARVTSPAVTLRCPPGPCFADCTCTCAAGYVEGACSNVDGGCVR